VFTFIEVPSFTASWKRLGLDDEALITLQQTVMGQPGAGTVVKGTGGLRKLRFAPEAWHTGKRGAVRVCYVWFEEFGVVLLVVAYSKSERDDLSSADRKTIRELIQRQIKELQRKQRKAGGHK
jgi:hypothetical protein